jgi:hypothetical protein
LHPLHHLYGGENAFTLGQYKRALGNAGIRLTSVLNPYESNINLYPGNVRMLKEKIARKLRFPWPHAIPAILLKILGAHCRAPGRLYSFIGEKTLT